MVHQCYFKHCKSAQTKHCKIKFHKFPTDEAMAAKWIEIVGKQPKAHSKICSRHFKRSDYRFNPKAIRPGLVITAVPCRNLTKMKDRFDSDFDEDDTDDTMSFASSEASVCEELVEEQDQTVFMCRTCLRETSNADDFESLMSELNVTYYTDLTNITIDESDTGSKLICSKCQLMLTNFHDFKTTCLQSNQYFVDQKNVKIVGSTVGTALAMKTEGEFIACDYETMEIEMLNDEPPQVENDESTLKQDTKDTIAIGQHSNQLETEVTDRAKRKVYLKKKVTKKSDEKKIKFKKILEDNGFIQCPHCSKQFLKINTFYKHKRDHFRTYMCTLCGKQYASQRSLTIHYQFIHTDERRFKCDLCGQAFKAKASLIDHMDTRHNNCRNYVCDRCSSAFKSKKSLDAHVRLVHSNLESKFECSHCDKKFKKKSYLVTHEQLHSGHKLYTCQLCEKSFTTKNSRDRHLERHSSNEHRPYQCRLCFSTFKRPKYHNRHIKKYHPEEPELPAIEVPLLLTRKIGKNGVETELIVKDALLNTVVVKTETEQAM